MPNVETCSSNEDGSVSSTSLSFDLKIGDSSESEPASSSDSNESEPARSSDSSEFESARSSASSQKSELIQLGPLFVKIQTYLIRASTYLENGKTLWTPVSQKSKF